MTSGSLAFESFMDYVICPLYPKAASQLGVSLPAAQGGTTALRDKDQSLPSSAPCNLKKANMMFHLLVTSRLEAGQSHPEICLLSLVFQNQGLP